MTVPTPRPSPWLLAALGLSAALLGLTAWLALRGSSQDQPPLSGEAGHGAAEPAGATTGPEAELAGPPESREKPRKSCLGAKVFQPDRARVIGPDRSQGASWRTRLVSCADIVDTEQHGRIMWFKYADLDGGSGIGRARWDEGWRVDPEPVITADELADMGISHVGCSTSLVSDGQLRIWFRANLDKGRRAIFAARSDGQSWQVDRSGPVLQAPGSWMGNSLWTPSVLRDGDTWRMYLRCGDRVQSTLCMATSSDGERWSMHPERIIKHRHRFEAEVYGGPQVTKHGNTYHLWYSHEWYPDYQEGLGADQDLQMFAEIGHASSEDPTWFRLHKRDPVLQHGQAGWMSHVVDSPMVVKEDGATVLYFRGAQRAGGLDGSIGRAVAHCAALKSPHTKAVPQGEHRKRDGDTGAR